MIRKILVSSLLLLAACNSEERLEKVAVTVSYPSDANQSQVSALHAWVVDSSENQSVSCNLLVAGEQEPYDVELQMYGEGGARAGEELNAAARKVAGLVYVVASDYEGMQLYAGCAPAASSVNVQLQLARYYNCTDATTPEGARCDDGNSCTTGDHCSAGTCISGQPRDCSLLNGACNTGVCVPGQGCVKQAANNGQPCDDNLFCTGPGSCNAGTCVLPPLVCPPPPGQCMQQGVCSETYDRCLYVPKPLGTACDDGDPCRTGDTCNLQGSCAPGSTVASNVTVECDGNACTAGDSCVSGSCSPGATASNATSCNDKNPCTINDYCSGTSCYGGGTAASTTPCWDTNYCTLGETCSGYSSCIAGGSYNYDLDQDLYYRAGAGCVAGNDCNDNDPNIHPGAAEKCNDGKDNNCDGLIDDASCVP